MKLQPLGAGLALAALCSTSAFAALFTCNPVDQDVITHFTNNSPQTAVCTAVSAQPGFVITGLAVALRGQYQDFESFTTHQLQFSAINSFNASTVIGSTNVDEFVGSTGFIQGATLDVADLLTLGDVTVAVNVISLGGMPLPEHAFFTAYIATQELPVPGVPEPTTIALLCGGMIVLALKRRGVRV